MRLILIFLIALSFPAFAQVYTWTDENGVTHFGAQPPPGQQEEVDVKPASGSASDPAPIESDIIRQARELERREREKDLEASRKRYRQTLSEIEQVSADSPDYICKGVENRLKSAREKWEALQVQGYTISEERYHKQRIKDAERHRDNICR